MDYRSIHMVSKLDESAFPMEQQIPVCKPHVYCCSFPPQNCKQSYRIIMKTNKHVRLFEFSNTHFLGGIIKIIYTKGKNII